MFTLLATIGFPLFLAAGGIATWLKIRKGRHDLPQTPVLPLPADEEFERWRRDRDADHERARSERSPSTGAKGDTGQGEDVQETRSNRQVTGG